MFTYHRHAVRALVSFSRHHRRRQASIVSTALLSRRAQNGTAASFDEPGSYWRNDTLSLVLSSI